MDNPFPYLLRGQKDRPPELHLPQRQLLLKGAAPPELSRENLLPFFSQSPFANRQRPPPLQNLLHKKPVREAEIALELFERIEGTEDLHRLPENFLELEIDRTGGPVVIDIRVKIETGIE